MKIELTNDEWISVLDAEEEGLPRCCANISALRDTLFQIVRDGRECGPFIERQFLRTYYWCLDHDESGFPIVKKIFDQVVSKESNQKFWEALLASEADSRIPVE